MGAYVHTKDWATGEAFDPAPDNAEGAAIAASANNIEEPQLDLGDPLDNAHLARPRSILTLTRAYAHSAMARVGLNYGAPSEGELSYVFSSTDALGVFPIGRFRIPEGGRLMRSSLTLRQQYLGAVGGDPTHTVSCQASFDLGWGNSTRSVLSGRKFFTTFTFPENNGWNIRPVETHHALRLRGIGRILDENLPAGDFLTMLLYMHAWDSAPLGVALNVLFDLQSIFAVCEFAMPHADRPTP